MRITPWIHIQYVHAATAPERFFEELWRIRGSVMGLRPDMAPEADYKAFRNYFNHETLVTTYRARDGTVQGFFGFRSRLVQVPGGPVIRIDPEYLFTRPVMRGHIAHLLGMCGSLLRICARHGFHRCAAVGVGYPPWVLSVSRISHRVRTLRDPDVEPWEREMLLDCVQTFWGSSFDPDTALVRMRTMPVEPRKIPRTKRGKDLLAWYESHNPRWRESFGLPSILHIDMKSVLSSLRRSETG
jgi:hypothetical protein